MSSIKVKTDIIKPIIDWIKQEHPDRLVIVDRPNKPRGPRPYFTVNISAPLQKVGSRDNVEHKSGDIFEISGQRTFTASIAAYVDGKNKGFFDAQDLLIVLQDSLEDPIKRQVLQVAGLAAWDVGDILDTSILIETGFEPRAQLDIIMGIASNRESDLGSIDKVEVQGTIDGTQEPKFDIPST